MMKAGILNKNRLHENTQKYTCTEDADLLTVKSGNRQFAFSKKTGLLVSVTVSGKKLSFGNGPRFVAAKRSDRSQDGFYNHDDKEVPNMPTREFSTVSPLATARWWPTTVMVLSKR